MSESDRAATGYTLELPSTSDRSRRRKRPASDNKEQAEAMLIRRQKRDPSYGRRQRRRYADGG